MGVVSNGMLCSGDELGLTADADGILILPATPRSGGRSPSCTATRVLDVDVKPNRGDALSIVGLAREVAGGDRRDLRLPPTTTPRQAARPPNACRRGPRPDLCPRFVGRWVERRAVGPSPDRIQMRLLAAGQRREQRRRRSQLRHVELGKPIHTFDARRPRRPDHRPPARAGERLETLDHVDRELTPTRWLIADPSGRSASRA
jgi:phenylalanyl-tRNA synthetase beta chain